jgi:ribosome biogenesis GTPase
MTDNAPDLNALGWTNFFAAQLDTSELETALPVRVTEVHRSVIHILGDGLDGTLPPYYGDEDDDEDVATVGDWLLLDGQTGQVVRLLDRKSLFKRRAAGTGRQQQMIAANIDTLFVVSSCNDDFNLPRLERYLVLARSAGVTPVIVLTKLDLTDDPQHYANQARTLQPGLLVETVNALDPDSVSCLVPWCGKGQTVALLGSSGVGKSTLVNTLTGMAEIATQGIRSDDSKGRHTTTGRALHRLPQGGWLMDTPGMRELQLTDVGEGIDDVFADVFELSTQCKFSDCAHETEPGCAVSAAIEDGSLDPERLKRWRKLAAEEFHNTATIAERHASDRAMGKMIKSVLKHKHGNKYDE